MFNEEQFLKENANMSIFDIDWNNDGKSDFQDTAMDCIILSSLEDEDDDKSEFDFDFEED